MTTKTCSTCRYRNRCMEFSRQYDAGDIKNGGGKEEQEMSSYRVFLSKSSKAVYAIAHGFGCDMSQGVNDVKSVKCGPADKEELIPAVYYGKGYFYAAAEFAIEEDEVAKYELIMC